MAEAIMMESAVVVPEDSSAHIPTTTNGIKRRQSEALEEQDSKRRRTSLGKTPSSEAPKNEEEEREQTEQQPLEENVNAPTKTNDTRESRRKSGVTDEKQRSKRLFGALLGNLNQPGDRVSRRRTEIEQRRKAELQKQDDERLEDRQKRLEKLNAKRKREQINVDEQHMHMRHKNLLKTANFLQTQTEPRLYYKPWDLLTDEEDRIEDQLKEAQDNIDDELADWEEEKQKRLDLLNAPDDSTDHITDAKPGVESADINDAKPKEDAIQEILRRKAGDEENNGREEAGMLDEKPAQPLADLTSGEEVEQIAKESEELGPENTQAAEDQSKPDEEHKEDAEDDGDHVVEGDEDTVIY